MNAKGDANRSVRTTKKKLYNALIQLLQEKDLREITVRELTGLAGISRGTFYFHYADIYALMEQMEATQLEGLCSLLDGIVPNASQEEVPYALVALFRYMEENAEVCRALYGKSWESPFLHNAKEVVLRRCMGEFPHGTSERDRYLLSFIVDGCFGTIQQWQQAGHMPPAPEMAETAWQAIRAVKRLL